MEPIHKKRYVAGFMFNDELDAVCLIQKNRPAWQAGHLNGIGGKVESGEASIDAMVREFREETGVETATSQWAAVCTLHFPYADVAFFAGKSTVACDAVHTTTDEDVGVFGYPARVNQELLVENIMPILLLSVQRLCDREGAPPSGTKGDAR